MTALYRGTIEQKLRLITGLILFTFALLHFVNHALGLHSIEAMQQFERVRLVVTRSFPGTIILIGAAITHIVLGLRKQAFRSTLKMPFWEAAQVTLGLTIPLMLIPHLVPMRFSYELFGDDTTYFSTLLKVWRNAPYQQSVLLLVVWIHGCIGLHFWLRLSDWYNKAFQLMFALALIIPLSGLAGYMVASRAQELKIATRQATEPSATYGKPGRENTPTGDSTGYERARPRSNASSPGGGYNYAAAPTKAQQKDAAIDWWIEWLSNIYIAMLVLTASVYGGRMITRRLGAHVEITYALGPTITARIGPTLLEISRMHNLPHASVCGGRGRCSTCRVRVESGGEDLPKRSTLEARTLASANAGPNDRLACQIRPTKKLDVVRILRPTTTGFASRDFSGSKARGEERELAILFLDVRGFTSMSAGKLPYDVVFILNQLFDATGEAIQANGGWIDKYLGDGLMAVFGKEGSAQSGSIQALRAAREIDLALDDVNAAIGEEAGGAIKIGMGLHVGPLILGEIGHTGSSAMTVIGRTVNAAARLEALTKQMQCQLIISTQIAAHAELPPLAYPRKTVQVRGIPEPLEVFCLPRARDLPTIV